MNREFVPRRAGRVPAPAAAAADRRKGTGASRGGGVYRGFSLARVAVTPRPAPAVQTKLSVSTPGDRWEREADQVADQVMRTKLDEPLTPAGGPRIQRMCSTCSQEAAGKDEDEEAQIQTAALPGRTPQVTPQVGAAVKGLAGRGRSLPASERAFFEPRFGTDFGAVRLHDDARAAQTARALDARAFTLGRDVVLGAGQPAPGTSAGRRLLAHELTHVMQQTGAGGGRPASGNGSGVIQRAAGDACYIPVPLGPYAGTLGANDANYNEGTNLDFTAAQKNEIYDENESMGIDKEVTAYYRSNQNGRALFRAEDATGLLAEIDHIVPYQGGGCNSFRNAQVLSKAQNLAKGVAYPWSNYNRKRVLDPNTGTIYNSKAAANVGGAQNVGALP